MKRNKYFFFLLVLLFSIIFIYSSLTRHPMSIFVLKGYGEQIEAFELSTPLNRQNPSVAAVQMTSGQKNEGREILIQKDVKHLLEFSKNFGVYPVVIGLPVTEEGWPGYMGGGFKGLIADDKIKTFDNLQWVDKLYFSFSTNSPPPAPFFPEVSSVPPPLTSMLPGGSAHLNLVPTTLATPSVVRVEILNGCGITNAADWVARRMKGSGIVIVDTGNADNFHYARTIVRTSAGVPVALEDAIDRLGLEKDSVEETSGLISSVDAIVIVGKDFSKLRERERERNRHRTQ